MFYDLSNIRFFTKVKMVKFYHIFSENLNLKLNNLIFKRN